MAGGWWLVVEAWWVASAVRRSQLTATAPAALDLYPEGQLKLDKRMSREDEGWGLLGSCSLGLTGHWAGRIWSELSSIGFTWFHLVSLVFTQRVISLVSNNCVLWSPLTTLGSIWFHMISFDII